MIHQITLVLFEPLICNASCFWHSAASDIIPKSLLNSAHMKYLVSVLYVLFSKKTPITAEERACVHGCAFSQRHKIESTLLTKLFHLIVGMYDKNAVMWN